MVWYENQRKKSIEPDFFWKGESPQDCFGIMGIGYWNVGQGGWFAENSRNDGYRMI